MLADIAPPLLLFGSLGGVIFLISRVISRLKRREFSAAVQAEGRRNLESPQNLLNPEESQVTLVKSRLAATATGIRESLTSLKQLPSQLRERRAQRISTKEQDVSELAPHRREASGAGIRAPHSSWRQQLGTTAEKVKSRLGTWRNRRRVRAAAQTLSGEPLPSEAAAPTQISLRRIDTPTKENQPRVETTAERLQAFVRKQRSTTTAVQEAQALLAAGNLDRAEDILIPYLAKNPRNAAAYMVLGQVALRKQSWDEAQESFEQVIRLDAATVGVFAKLGEASLGGGHVTRALEALQRAHDADPKDVGVLKHLLNIAQRTDNRVLQKSVIQKLIMLAPDDAEVHLAAEALEAREREREQTPTA